MNGQFVEEKMYVASKQRKNTASQGIKCFNEDENTALLS